MKWLQMGKRLAYAWYETKLDLCTYLFSFSKSTLYPNASWQNVSLCFMTTGTFWQDMQSQLAVPPGRPPVAIMAVQSAWGARSYLLSLNAALMLIQPSRFPNFPPLIPAQSQLTCLSGPLLPLPQYEGGTCILVSSCSFLPVTDGLKNDLHYPCLPKSHPCIIPSPWVWARSGTCF